MQQIEHVYTLYLYTSLYISDDDYIYFYENPLYIFEDIL